MDSICNRDLVECFKIYLWLVNVSVIASPTLFSETKRSVYFKKDCFAEKHSQWQ